MNVLLKEPERFRLENNKGVEVEFLSHAGRIFSVKVPDGNKKTDIVLGGGLDVDLYMGAICGRFANRIANGIAKLDDEFIRLPVNEPPNHLHGGAHGFHTKVWKVEPFSLEGYEKAFRLTLFSPDGDEGYPGNLQAEAIYALNDRNELFVDLKATTDKPTIINLTVHPYFNLNGVQNGNILNHKLQIFAGHYAPIDKTGIPTGEIAQVAGTDMDFREPAFLSKAIQSTFPQIVMKEGLDHTWVLDRKDKKLIKAGVLAEPESGRAVEIFTTQPALQAYTGNHFDGSHKDKSGTPLKKHAGVAVEAQNIPDAPNKPNFPNAILRPGGAFHEQVVYRFIF